MIDVVAAVIQTGERFLLARRSVHKTMGGKWEFPGGKVEAGESPQAALKREIREEFGVDIIVGELICKKCHRYPDVIIRLSAYYATTKDKIEKSTDHDQLVWVLANRFNKFDLAEADLPVALILSKSE